MPRNGFLMTLNTKQIPHTICFILILPIFKPYILKIKNVPKNWPNHQPTLMLI